MEYIPVLIVIFILCVFFMIGGLTIELIDKVNVRQKSYLVRQAERARIKAWCQIQCEVYDRQGKRVGKPYYNINKTA
jgi:hypothetical protein